jgi:hypothetical protein
MNSTERRARMPACIQLPRIPRGILFFALTVALVSAPLAFPQSAEEKTSPMHLHASGSFDVKGSPLPSDDATGGAAIGRNALDKQFHGDLDAISKGLMLSAGDPKSGTAGYVAIEHVTGTLHGRSGSFALQHFGTMSGGKYDLKVIVVPGSATGDLAGLEGTMTIVIAGGKHSYEFDYTLPGSK